MVAAALLGAAPAAKAATLNWDGADLVTSGAQGGAGTWDTSTTANWWDGTSNIVWPALGGTDDDAIFGGTAGTVTIAAGGVTANDLTFNSTGYVLGGGVLTLNGASPTITVGSGLSASITAKISGASGLTKSGNGSLTLSGANDYAGVTAINAGTLKAGNGTALGGLVGGTTVAGGATLDIGGQNLTTEVITIAGTGVGGLGAIINTGGEQTNALGRLALSADATIGGAVRWDLRNSAPTLDLGGFTLTKTGTTYIAMVGAATTNPGNIVINQGELSLSTSTTLAGSSANSVTVNNGGTLSLYQSSNAHVWTLNLNTGSVFRAENGNRSQNFWVGPVNVSGATTLTADSGQNLTILGALSGTAGLTKTAAGTVVIGGNYALTGNITIAASGGTLQLGTGGANGTLTSNTISIGSGANLIFNRSSSLVQGTDFGALSGAGSFAQNGSGNTTFGTATAQTYTGSTAVNRGTLTLDFANLASPTNMISASSALTFGGGRLTVLGGSAGTTTQAFAGTTVAAGASSLAINRGTGTSTTVTLGAVTRSAGGTVTFVPTTAWGNPTPSTTEIATVASISNVNGAVTMPLAGATAYAGAGFFVGSGTGTRYAVIQGAASGPYRLMGSPSSTAFVNTGGVATTLYSITTNQTLTGATTNYALIGNAAAASTIATSAANTYTANGIINIQTGTITISGAGALLIGAERDFVANMANTGGLTISSVVANNGANASNFTVNSTGTGVVTLSNAANTYTGITTINSGTLAITADLNLGAAPGAVVANGITMNGGTLSMAPVAGITILTNRGLTLGAGGGTWTNTSGNIVTYGGVITGPGALTLNTTNAAGGFTFGTTSTFTGGATLSGSGTIYVANGSAFGVGGTLTLNGSQLRASTGADLTIANPVSIAANTTFPSVANEKFIAFSGPAVITGGTRTLNVGVGGNVAGKTISFTGPLSEATAGSGLTKSGTGELVLSGVTSYTGATTVSAGRLSLNRAFSLYGGNTASWTDTNLSVAANATLALRVGGFNEFTAANIATLSALGTATGGFLAGSFLGLDTGSGNFTYNNAFANTNAGTNAFGLIKLGANTLTLGAASTYTGSTMIGGGVLTAANPAAFGPAGNTVFFITTPAAGSSGGNMTSGNLEFATDASVNAYNLSGSTSFASTLTLSRATSGAAFQHALGTLIWGNNVFNLNKGANVTSGTPSVSFAGMNLTAGSGGTATLNPTDTNIFITGPVNIPTNNQTKVVGLDGNTTGNLISGDISNGVTGTLGVSKTNTSTWTISGGTSYTGTTTVTAGTLIISGNHAASGATTINGGTLVLAGTATGAGATNVVGGTLQAGADGALNPNSAVTMTDAAAAVLDLNGKTGTIASLSGGGALGGNVTLGGGTLTTGASGASTAYAGNITGAGNLIKSGAGTFTLSSAQAYAGATSVSNGTLLVNSTLASSATTVASGATLGGTGTLTNAVTVSNGGTLSPATSTTPGTLTIGSLTLDPGALLNFEFGGTSDLVAVTTPSGLTINGGALSLFATGGLSPLTTNGTYTLLTYATAFGGDKNNLSVFNSQAGKTYALNDTGSALQLVIGTATSSDWSGAFADGLWTSDGVGGNWTDAAAPATLGAVVNFGLTPSAPTTVTLNGAKTVGSIIFNNANSYVVGTTSDAITLDNGIAAGAVSVTTGSHTVNAPIVLNGPANITPAATTSLTFGGAISGAGKALTFSGAGAVTLNAANTYGSTILSAGTLNLGNDGALGSGLVTISGGTLDAVGGARALSGNNLVNLTGDFAFAGTNNLAFGTGALSIQISRTLTVSAGSLTFGGAANGAGFTKAGAGTLALTGSTSFTGAITLSANGGTLILSGNNSARPAGSQGLTTINSGATLQLQANSGNTSAGISTALSSERTAAQPLILNNGSTLQLRGDSSVTFAGANDFGGLGTATVAIDVGRLTSAGADNVLTLAPGGFAVSGTTLNVTGANGYSLRLPAITTAAANTSTYNPTSANLSIGTYAASAAATLALAGTSTGNVITGTVSGALNIIKSGSGIWDLQGANTYTGTTTVREGTLTLSGNRTAASGGITVGDTAGLDATLNISAGTHNFGGGQMNIGNAPTTAITGTVNQSGGQVIFTAGGGNQILVGQNSVANRGVYNLSGGSLTIGLSTAAGRGIILGVNTGSYGGTFNLSGTGLLNMTLASGGTGDATLAIGRLDSAVNNTINAFNQSGGTANIGVLGLGGATGGGTGVSATLSLTGGTFRANQFTALAAGGTNTAVINIGGTADVTLPAFPTARGAGSTATLNFDGGTLKPLASSAAYLGGLTNAFVKAGGATFDTNTFNITVSQALLADPVSTGGGLTKAGNGVLTLSGANTFTGDVAINGGVLALGNAAAFNATAGSENAVAFGAGSTGTLRLNGNSLVIARLDSNATLGAPMVENASATNVTLTVGNSANLSGTFAGVLQDGTGGGLLGLTKVGNGTLTLSGANTYSGATTISAGTVAAGASNALPANSDIVLADSTGVALSLGGFTQSIKSLSGGGTTGGNVSLGNDGALTINGAGSFGGVISGTGSSGLNKAGNGTLTLSGASTYAGATTVTGGTLALGGAGSVNNSSGVTINGAGATFAHNGSVAVSAPVTLTQGSVSGTGTLSMLTVADLAANTLAPGAAGIGTLTVGSLDFLGAAKVSLTSNGSAVNGLLSTNSLNTNGSQNILVDITGVPLGGWTSGTYDLISYGSLGGSGAGAFALGTIAGTTARTSSALINQSGKLSLTITNNIAKWSGADDGVWSATTTGNWKLDPSGATTDYIEGEAVVFDDTASGTTIVTIDNTVAPSAVTFNNSSKEYTLDGMGFMDPSLSQSVGLVKNGTGRLIINATNLYTGATVINAGNVTMGGFGLLGQNAPLTLAGGQLDLGATDQTVGAVSITSAAPAGFTLDNGILTAPSYLISNPTGDVLIGANLRGANATFTKNGAGSATLSAANTFGGAVTVNTGTLTVTGTGNLGGTSAINLAGGSLVLSTGVILASGAPLTFTGGSFDLGTTIQTVGAVSVTSAATSGATITNGSLTGASYAASNATGDAVINAALLANGAIGFTKTGNGRVTLGGANTYTGATTVSAGTLAAGSSSAFTGLNALAISGNATFDLNGYNATFSGDVTTAPATVTITDNAAGAGTSTIRFLQTSATTITTPTLIVDGPSRKVAVTFSNANGDQRFTNANNTFSGGINILGSALGGRMSVSAVPVNTFVSGVLTASPFGTGPITVGQVATDRAGIYFPTANVTLANPIVANTTLGTDRTGTFRIDTTGLTLSGQLTAGASDMALSTNGTGTVTLSGRITGTNGLRLLSHTLGGTSLTVTLANAAGTNDYSGNTTINDNAQSGRSYTLVLGASDQIPNGAGKGNVIINTNGTGAGTLRLQGFSDTINGLTGTGNVTTTVAGASVLTLGDGDATASFSGTITESVGTVGLTKIGAGTQTLTTSMAYTGGTTITAGTLVLGHATNTLADTGSVTVNGGTLSLGTNNETVGTVTLSSGTLSGSTGVLTSTANYDLRGGTVAAILGGTVGLNKTTAGTTDVTSVNAFTGATSVTNGALRLSGAGDINSTSGITVNGAGAKFVQSSSVAVAKDVTLAQGTVTGSGTINTVNVGAGAVGVVSNNDGVGGAGLTVGSLSVDGSVNFSAFTDGTALIPLTITTLTNNGAVTITANNAAGWINGTTYDLLTYGSVSGTGANNFTYAANNKSARQTESWTIVNSVVKLTIDGTKPYWTGGTDNKWNTSATGNWKLLADNSDTVFLPSDDVLFNDGASGTGTVTIDLDAANVATSLTLFENATRDYVLTGAFGISAGSLTKNGAGSLTIATANTYSGATTLNAGNVILTGAGRLGTGSALTLGGSSLDLGATSQTIGALSVTTAASSGATIGNGSIAGTSYAVSNASGTAVISANLLVNGSAGFTKSGAGAVTLSGANTFTGGFTLNAGTVNINSAGALGAGAVNLVGGSLDNLTGSAASFANVLTINGDFTYVGSSDLSFTAAATLGSAAGSTRVVTVNGSALTLGVVANGLTANCLTKAGAGTLVLSGVNTYNGVTTVQNGLLRLTGSLPAASTLVLGNNTDSGKFALGSSAAAVNQTLAGISVSGTGTANAIVGGNAAVSTLTVTNTTTTAYAGRLGGSGTNENNLALTKTGAGALTLSGASTYDGATTISPGAAIIVAADGALGSTTGNTLLGGVASGNAGVLGLSGGITYATTEKVIGVGAGNTAAVAGLVNIQRGLIQSVSGNNTFAGNLELSATGLSRVGVQDGAQLTMSGPITRATGLVNVQILFRAGVNDGDFITLASSANDWDMDARIYTTNPTASPTGAGAGLRLGVNNALPTATSIYSDANVGAGTTFDLAGFNQRLNGLTSGAYTLRIANSSATLSTLTLDNLVDKATGAGTVIIDGAGAGKVAVVKIGSFSQAFQSANTYTGGTWIKDGVIRLWSGNDRLAVTGTVTLGDVSTSGKLAIGETGTARAQTLAGLTATGQGGSVVGATTAANSTLTLNIASGTNTFDGTLGGAGTNENNLTLTKTGNGILDLTNAASTYAGVTTVNGGTLRVASLGTTGASSVGASDRAVSANLTLNGAVRLEYAGTGEATSRSFAVTGSGLTLAASGSGALDFTSSANVAFATDGASARELRLAGSNTGDNTYAATAAGTPLAADVFSKIVKNEVGKWVVAGNGTTFADNLQVEVNAGLLAFGQASQLRAGSAVVNGGTLFVATGTNTGASVTVNNGGTLGGSASLGAVTVNNGGALSPGASPGVFTASSLSLAGGSIISWQVSDAFGAAGTGYDQLAVTGNLDLTGASSANKIILKIGSLTALDANGDPLNFGAPNGVASIRTFQFGQVGGVLLNNGVNISDVFAFDVSDFTYSSGSSSNAGLWSINWNAGTGAITLTAVPEPSTYGIGLGALALAAAALRRRRRPAPQA